MCHKENTAGLYVGTCGIDGLYRYSYLSLTNVALFLLSKFDSVHFFSVGSSYIGHVLGQVRADHLLQAREELVGHLLSDVQWPWGKKGHPFLVG